MALRVRRDIWTLKPDDPIIVGYRKAVEVMKARKPEKVTSWSYQAAIHGIETRHNQRLWNQCQHFGWYFFPWHRMYILHFEEIVRKAIGESKLSENWALPYWNYGLGGENLTLPRPFREPTVDGKPNPLYVKDRKGGINSGAKIPAGAASAVHALSRPHFIGKAEFGGGETAPGHFQTQMGQLEGTPHGAIHVEVGGWMSNPDTAAQDPIFWLHHSNIDRLWTVWNAEAGRVDPTQPKWLTQQFELFDPKGDVVKLSCEEVRDTKALGYIYSTAATASHPPIATFAVPALAAADDVKDTRHEMVGATDKSITLVGDPVAAEVPIDASAAGELVPAQHVYLNVEDIEADRNPGVNYGVYVELPSDPAPETEAAHHVGNLSFFGIEISRDPHGDEHAHGLNFSADISGFAHQLAGEGKWAGHPLSVSFRPLELVPPEDPDPEDEVEAASHPDVPVTIGRISVFYDA